MANESQAKGREKARGRCSLCQSWQIGQLPVRCDEEGRRGRKGRLKGPWQAGKRRTSRLKAAGGNALVAGKSPRTLSWRWMTSYLKRSRQRDGGRNGHAELIGNGVGRQTEKQHLEICPL